MPRSVSIHPDRKQTVENALKRNGFLTQGDLAAHIGKAVSTVNNFFTAKKVAISTFEEICEALGLDKREIQKPLESGQDKAVKEISEIIPTLYNPEKWVGRSQLIEKLLNQLQQNTRIVWLTGLSGIGKTTLGECIAVKAWESDPSFYWLHLEISASQLPDFATGAREILSQLGEKDLDLQEMNDPKRLGDRLLNKLQSSFYWLQIDAVEKLILANEFIDSYWLTFLESCLNTNHFPSCLLLTSQVLPNSLINWCDRFSNIWHQETLKGLENEESEQYFAKNSIVVKESNQDILNCIGQTYEGHPLVLQVITGEILQVYQGDLTAYWQVNQAEFEQVSRELKSSRLTETDYNEQLARRVRERVKKSLEQLPEKAIALLCRSAVYRRPVLKKFWLDLMTEYSPKEQLEAYRVLGDRALIETERNLIRLHNLVRDIAYDWLREDEAIWKATEVKAAELWLNDYQPEENAENLEKVRGYLEAFYHYCNIEDYKLAKKITQIRLAITNNQELHYQLFIWAYYNQLIEIYNFLLTRLETRIDIICYKGLAQINHNFGNYNEAVDYHHRGLILSQEINDNYAYLVCCNGLSNTYIQWGKYQDSIQILNDALKQNNYPRLQVTMYNNLGNAYYFLKNIQQSFDCYKLSLEVSKSINDDQITASIWSSIARNYSFLGNFKESETIIREILPIAEKAGDFIGIASLKANLGMNLYFQSQELEAFSLLTEALNSFNGKHLRGQVQVLFSLGILYYEENNLQLAQQHCEQALQIATELGIPLAQKCQELLSKIEEAENNSE